MSDDCNVTYLAQYRTWDGLWFTLPTLVAHSSSHEAREAAREFLARKGYRDVPVRIVKVHTHRTVEVLDETDGAA